MNNLANFKFRQLAIPCIFAILSTACASTPAEPVLARYPEAADMQPCSPLDKPADGTLASLYRSHVSAAHRYHDCRARHDNLIEWIKRGIEAGNAVR